MLRPLRHDGPRAMRQRLAALALVAAIVVPVAPATAQSPVPTQASGRDPATAPLPGGGEPLPTPETWAIHGQSTFTEIYQPAFRSTYRGPNSLDPGSRGRETLDITLYGGFRPWRGAEIWINPEVDQGFGPSNTFGLAGYVSAEAYKLGQAEPYVRLPRVFFRQTIDLGGEVQAIAPDLNQLGGSQRANRVVLTVGKFSSFDIFDTNKYAHDPRNDFLNWSLIDAGTFDQAGDAWGFSYGAALEWYQDRWAVRGGIFDLPTTPGYKYLDTNYGRQLQYIAEVEERHTLFGQDGKVKLSGFYTRGRMGSFGEAIVQARATGTSPDIQQVLRIRGKGGGSVNVEQAITSDIGFFFRAGVQDGTSSTTSYTDINNTVSFGVSLAGTRWNRPDDTAALGVARNDITRHFKNYLNAGGLGILVGDGKLPNSGPEKVLEAFYSVGLVKGVHLTLDYQLVSNPAYNRDRGPVSFLGARLHAQF